jgi:hypothetical protein
MSYDHLCVLYFENLFLFYYLFIYYLLFLL